MTRALGILFFVLILIWLYTMSHAQAHDDYPADCCDGSECKAVACSEIKQIASTAWRYGRSTFNASAVRLPIDDRCHVCASEPLGRCIMFPRPKMM